MVPSDQRQPVQDRLKSSRQNLHRDQHDQRNEEQRAASEITPIERHGHGIAAGFAKRGGGDLDNPKDQGNFRNLAQHLAPSDLVHAADLFLVLDQPQRWTAFAVQLRSPRARRPSFKPS
jgi:hypothetical protein